MRRYRTAARSRMPADNSAQARGNPLLRPVPAHAENSRSSPPGLRFPASVRISAFVPMCTWKACSFSLLQYREPRGNRAIYYAPFTHSINFSHRPASIVQPRLPFFDTWRSMPRRLSTRFGLCAVPIALSLGLRSSGKAPRNADRFFQEPHKLHPRYLHGAETLHVRIDILRVQQQKATLP